MRKEDNIYVENNTLAIVKLYTESYLLKEEKGFRSVQEEQDAKETLEKNIQKGLQEESEYLCVDVCEIIAVLQTCLEEEKKIEEKNKNFGEEYKLLENVLQTINSKEHITKNEEERG